MHGNLLILLIRERTWFEFLYHSSDSIELCQKYYIVFNNSLDSALFAFKSVASSVITIGRLDKLFLSDFVYYLLQHVHFIEI